MSQSVFYSFHYELDNWRVQQVMNMGAVSGNAAFTPQNWEEVRYKTDAAIENWIHNQMKHTKAVIVLVGAKASERDWVRYEIIKAWNDKRPLLGVRIHGLLDRNRTTSQRGNDPFANVSLENGSPISDYVTLVDPPGADSQTVYNNIQNGLEYWINSYAYKRP